METLLKPLQIVGKFKGLDATTSPFDLTEGHGSVVSNVDVSAQTGAFVTAQGRTILSSFGIPASFDTINCVTPFYSFSGSASVSSTYIICVCQSTLPTNFAVYSYDSGTATSTRIVNAASFTDAVQFNSALWTNGGQVLRFVPQSARPGYSIAVDPWQVQVAPAYAFNLGATTTASGGTSQIAQQWQYAVTWRRSFVWTPLISTSTRTNGAVWYPDLDTYQESSPIFTPLVTTTNAQYPSLSVLNSLSQALLETGTQTTSIYLGALYRWSTANPTFTFVDYLINLAHGTGADGNPCWIDTYLDSALTNNATLIQHQDPPPIVGQVYPGPANNNITIVNPQEQLAQQAFTYTNPTFLAKYKNRMWAFTNYPNQPLLPAATGSHGLTTTRVSFQPQLWYSDAGEAYSFNDATGFVLVGPEDTPGNYALTSAIASQSPWEPFLLPDTPVGSVETGSLLCLFKADSTWVMMGDTPNDFAQGIRNAFNIGCVAPDSITAAEGGVFWLAEEGVYFYDGGAPTYIGEAIRGGISNLTGEQLQTAVGSYDNTARKLYMSFPSLGVTYVYYVPTQDWYELPYSFSSLFYDSHQNYIVGAGISAGLVTLSEVDASPAQDLGLPITSTWTSSVTSSENSGLLKVYKNIILTAPVQEGSATVNLLVDGVSVASPTWNLSKGPVSRVFSIPNGTQGYTCQLTITASCAIQQKTPIVLWQVVVTGDVNHTLLSTADQDGMGGEE